jgi:uncharacterized protein DUF4337
MAEEGFEVHGPERHHVEHSAQAGDRLAARVAMMTALLSTAGAWFSYQGGFTQNEAMMYKNEAVLKRTEASDQWAFYQAKSNKQHLSELASVLVPADKRASFESEAERYKKEKKEIQAKAEALEAETKHFNELSEHAMHPHHRLALATTFIQIAISLAAITVLTRKVWLVWGALAAAAIGIVMGSAALFVA